MRVWRYAQFSDRYHRRFGDTFGVRIGALPVGILASDRDAIRRLFTGDPLVKRHGNDLLGPFLGEQSVLVLEPAEHLPRRKTLLPPFHGDRVQAYARLMEQQLARSGTCGRIASYAQPRLH
jgi:cytochrome P450